MKTLLYIGHAFHNKTKSSQFIQDLLATKYEITKFDFNPYKDSSKNFKQLAGKKYDVVVLWQIMPKISKLKKYVNYDYISFFPMYDATPEMSNTAWLDYDECNIINFSKTLHEKCKKHGFSSFYIQYFPKPQEITNQGDEKSVFFWQRRSNISSEHVEKVIGIENINKLYWHNVPDPNEKIIPPRNEWGDKTIVSNWFDTKEEANNYLQKASLYFAPREFEGIGMSFLEAMAYGRCVISPDNPTMNEYIVNGENGYLYNLKEPEKIQMDNVRQIQENAYNFIKEGYKKWEEDKIRILDWIETDVESNSDKNLINSMTFVKRKILYKKIYTKKYKIFYIFGFIKIKLPR